jgi:hypothetical protein
MVPFTSHCKIGQVDATFCVNSPIALIFCHFTG